MVEAARQEGVDGAVPVLPIHDTLKRVDERGVIVDTIGKEHVRLAQVHPPRPGPRLEALGGHLVALGAGNHGRDLQLGAPQQAPVREQDRDADGDDLAPPRGVGGEVLRQPAGHLGGVGRAHALHGDVGAPEQVPLVEQLRQPRRAEVLEGHAVDPVVLLQRAQLLEDPVAHEPRPVGRAHDRVVEGVDDVVAGVAAHDLARDHVGDLLRGDELHRFPRSDSAELLEGEDPVLARVDEDALQRVSGRPRPGGIDGTQARSGDERLGLAGIVQRHRPALAEDLAEADPLPRDGGRGLDLLRDGPARRAGHQEEQQRVGAGQRALGEEHPRRLLLRVRVRDVEAHTAGARGPDLDVDAGARLDHRLVEDLDVADELGHVVGEQHRLQALAQIGALAQGLVGEAARLVDVLVRDAGGGIDRVHDDVGALGGDELVEEVLRRGRFRERLDEALDHAGAHGGIGVRLQTRAVLDRREGEDVTPCRLQLHAARLGSERGHGFFRLCALEREQDQAAG